LPFPAVEVDALREPAAAASAAAVLTLIAATASAQSIIKVDDTINFRLGVLLQPQADWTEAAGGATGRTCSSGARAFSWAGSSRPT
jgi:hypothetical protein